MGTVRDKLQEDAKKDSLVVEEDVTIQDPSKPNGATVRKELRVKEYRGDLQRNFDEILSAVGDYFDLFKNNTDKLEALWLQLLDYLEVPNMNACRIFRDMHYTIYVKTVIKNRIIQAIINEAKRWSGTPAASKHLHEHLVKIAQIESDHKPTAGIPETYETFNRHKALDYDLNEYTRTEFAQKQQLELQQKNQQMRQAQQQTQSSNDGTKNSACQSEYRDCSQF